ncbi:forkhead box protein C1-like [Lethenteron reissneri]|uniref:forkhead box protein C1-like n=1 Tax=Lethenteron reissneri TaxID=7753 RepID=UPI002AB7EDE4|nr:forkhead box protein C1-like [Lethenteron reissneri]XP_061437209.1 forkhead box protein C1-like [Lethenteron reissneri]XP_061437216.1 forkhead box protein C1-like [Lethenteron reissneri]
MGPVMPPVKKSTLTTFPLGRHLAPGSQSPPRATRLSLGANFGVFCLNATAAAATVPRPLSRRRPSQQQHHQQPAVRKRWAIGADGDDLTSLQWLHEDPCLLHGLGLGAQPRADPCLSDGKLGASGSSSGGDGGRFAGGHAFGAAAKGCPGDGALLLQPLSGEDKPPYSFSCLIFLAMEEAPGKRLPVHSIYEWIAARFPYFARAPDGWKNSIRHNLSLNKCFRKADRGKDPGKGSLWGVQPEYRPVLLDALRRTGYWTRSLTDKPSSPSSPSSPSPSSPPLPVLQPVPLSPRRSRHAPRHGWSAFALRSSSSLVRAHRSLSSFHAADRRSSMVVKSLHGTGPWRGSRLDCADTVKPCPRSRGPWCRPATATAPALQPLAEGGVAESERRSEAYMRLVRGRDSKLYLKRGQGPWPSRRHPPAAGDEIGEACGPVAGGASGTGSGDTSDAGGMGKADVKPAATIGGSAAVVATEAVKPAVKPEPEAVGDSGGNAVDGAGVEAEHPSTGVGTVPSDDTRNPGGGDNSAGVDVADGRSVVVVRSSGGGGGSIRRAGCTNALADHNYGLSCPPPTPPPAPPVVPLQPPAAPSGHVHRQTRREKPSGRRWKRACREAVKRGRVGREDGEVEQEGSEGVTTTSSSSRRGRHRKRRRGDERREEQQQLSWEARVAGVDEDVREAVTSLLFLAGIDVGPLWRPPAGAAVALGAVAVAPARRGTAQLS